MKPVSEEEDAIIAIVEERFARHPNREIKSAEYEEGFEDQLRSMILKIPLSCPFSYGEGSPERDAYFAGAEEGETYAREWLSTHPGKEDAS